VFVGKHQRPDLKKGLDSCLDGLRKAQNISVRTFGVPSEIRTWFLPNTNQNVIFSASFLDVSFSYIYILILTNSSSKPILTFLKH